MKIEKIILNGCSFVHGFDITYEKNNIEKHSRFDEVTKAWSKDLWDDFNSVRISGQLKKLLDCDNIENLAKPGYSNEYIASKTIDYINSNLSKINPKTTIVMIGWTDFCRTVLYSEKYHAFHYSLPYIENYLKIVADQKPKTPKIIDYLKLLKKFEPISQEYFNDVLCTTTDYYRHINLILMLQFYLELRGIKYIFWNNLLNAPRVTFYNKYYPVEYKDIENQVDWSNWAPDFNKESYDKSWEEIILNDKVYQTASAHPSEEGVKVWAEKLANLVKTKY